MLYPFQYIIIKVVGGLVIKSCTTLCNPMDCSPPGYFVYEILQARILEWVAISFSKWCCILFSTSLSRAVVVVGGLVTKLCPTFCDPMDYNLPGYFVYKFLQTIILEWVSISFSIGSSQLRDQTHVSCIAGGFFSYRTTREALLRAAAAAAKSFQSCSTLCDPVDGSPPGSPIPGILQARSVEWVSGPILTRVSLILDSLNGES